MTRIGDTETPFADFIKSAYMARIQLSAAGFYKTPKIHWNRDIGACSIAMRGSCATLCTLSGIFCYAG